VIKVPGNERNRLYRPYRRLRSHIWLRSYPDLTVEAATDFLEGFNISANMARQGGRVQLEQSDMRLVLNMAKMAK